jgi:NADPH-dependent 2,4-dienoyl-CoA reductase/sulfur reductase-like enzyme
VSEAPNRIAVVGAGLAGLRAVEALRRTGHDGWLALIGDEIHQPYDRPPLSKEVLTAPDRPARTTFRGADALAGQGVELYLGTAVERLDLTDGFLELGAERLPFDGLIIATGAAARNIPALEGLEGVHTLRTHDDALAIRSALERSEHIVVIGAGFIGSEVAASARARGLDVTIIEAEHAPLTRILGPELGRSATGLHREHGTDLRLGAGVVDGEQAADGGVRLRLTDDSIVEADAVVVGIGVSPNTDWLLGSGINVGNGIVCDSALNAGYPSVFAVGDVAEWPNPLFDRRMRVEHWTNAIGQARHAARNLLTGKRDTFNGSNYFWSDQYGIRIQFAGVSTGQTMLVDGSIEQHRFVAWYLDQRRLVGVFAMASPELFTKSQRQVEARAQWRDALDSLERTVAQ